MTGSIEWWPWIAVGAGIVAPVVVLLLAAIFGGEHLHSDGSWK